MLLRVLRALRENLFTLILLLITAACTKTAATHNTEINRIISAAPSNTEIIVALGMGDRLIAVDKYSSGIDGVPEGLPEIDFFYPDTEAVIQLKPDLIISNEVNSFGVANNPFKLLGDFGIRVVQIPNSSSIEGICGDIVLIAETLGVKERGEAIVKSMRDEIKKITETHSNSADKKSVYFEISSVPTMVTFGSCVYLHELIEIAGGINIFADQKNWFSPSAEEIIVRNPDVIIALFYQGEDAVSEIKSRAAFRNITAIRENRVYAIDADAASRPSQNVIMALMQITAALNPDYENQH